MSTAIYIGAGLDIIPPIVCLDICRFIYVDAAPFQTGGERALMTDNSLPGQPYSYYLAERDRVMQQIGFAREIDPNITVNEQQMSPSCYVYRNNETKQEIFYYDNTSFPSDIHVIAEWLALADTMIFGGYNPILPAGSFPFPNIARVITNIHTVYAQAPDNIQDELKYQSSVFFYYQERSVDIDLLCERVPYPNWIVDDITRDTAKLYDIIKLHMNFMDFDEVVTSRLMKMYRDYDFDFSPYL